MSESNWPTIALGGAGNIYVAWNDLTVYSGSGTDKDIFYKLKNATTGIWTTTEVISTESTGGSWFPKIAVDGAWNIHVTWSDYTDYSGSGTDLDIFYKFKNATTGIWTTTEVVSTESTGESNVPTFALDGAGNIHIAWHDLTVYGGSGIDRDIFYKFKNATTGTWKTTEIVSTESTDDSMYPKIIVDGAGYIHVVWVDFTDYGGSGTDMDIFYKLKNVIPIINFEISQQYLNTTTPLETDLALEINCSITSSSNLKWVYLSENSTGVFINRSMSLGVNGEWTYIVDISGLDRGDKLMFSFYANDSNGNIGQNNNNGLNFSVIIGDFLLPYSNISYQILDSPNYISKSTLFTLNAADIGQRPSGLLNVSFRIDSGSWNLYTNPFNLTGYSHGNHTIYYYATDIAGNTEVINQESVFLDIQGPNITFSISPLYLSTTTPQYYHTELTINCSTQDNVSVIWVYLCENSTGTFLNRTMSKLNGSYTFNLDISSLNWSDLVVFSFYGNDSAGNINWNNNGGLNYAIEIYDFQDPSSNLSFQAIKNPNFVSNSTLFNFNGTDNGNGSSGVYNISYRIDLGGWSIYSTPFNLAGYSHGNHTIYYYATDNAGNSEVMNQEIIFIDIKKPNITFSISPLYLSTTTPEYYHTDLQISCIVQDNTSIIWVYLSENSTGTFVNRTMSMFNGSYTFNLDISSLNWSNTLMLSFYANDSAGNIQWDNNGGLYYLIQIYDFQDPVTSIGFTLSFNPNFVRNFTLFSLLTNDNIGIGGSGEKTIGYNIDGNGWNNFIVPFNLSGYNEGLHTIYFNATDHAGNIEFTNQITIYLDINNISSSLDFIYYEDSGIKYVNNFSQFTIIWNDGTGSGLQNIYYKIDSGPFSPYSVSFDLLGYSEGFHNISYYSIDNVGNIEPEKSVIMYLDIAALDLNINYNVIYGLNYVDENTNISITSVEDLGSGVKNVQFKFDEGIWINGTIFDLKGLAFGEHTIHYRVEDNIGNFNEKSETLFLVTFVSDLDNDGLTYQEELSLSTDPFDEDTDGDKLSDGDEVNLYKTNPHSQDSDGDGYSDYDEIFKYGTDPNSALSSPTMNITIFIAILSTITISGYVGVKKWKVVHRKRVEDEVFTRISEDKIKVLDHNAINERLQKIKSKLNFEIIGKKRGVNGQYILNGALFVKDIGIEKFETLINDIVKKIYDQNLSKREDVNLIKLNIKDLEQNEKLMEFIKKLKGERE